MPWNSCAVVLSCQAECYAVCAVSNISGAVHVKCIAVHDSCMCMCACTSFQLSSVIVILMVAVLGSCFYSHMQDCGGEAVGKVRMKGRKASPKFRCVCRMCKAWLLKEGLAEHEGESAHEHSWLVTINLHGWQDWEQM